jgi:hypothetical protein
MAFPEIITKIGALAWDDLTEAEMIDTAWAYYFFSVQFRENLQIARSLHPTDEKLRQLEREECDTDNLSPWPGVAEVGEKLNHDDFMKRLLRLWPIDAHKRAAFQADGEQYLRMVRSLDPTSRALSIASYEDGGLECVFRAILRAPESANPLIQAFRHFLSEHIRFDSDPEQGHGALSRHMVPDDRILPLWDGFAKLLLAFVPGLASRALIGDRVAETVTA